MLLQQSIVFIASALLSFLVSLILKFSIQTNSNINRRHLDPSKQSLITIKQLYKSLVIRFTFLEWCAIRKSCFKLNNLLFLSILSIICSFQIYSYYWAWSIGTISMILFIICDYLIYSVNTDNQESQITQIKYKKLVLYGILSFVCMILFCSIAFINYKWTINFAITGKIILLSFLIDQILARPIILLIFSAITYQFKPIIVLRNAYQALQIQDQQQENNKNGSASPNRKINNRISPSRIPKSFQILAQNFYIQPRPAFQQNQKILQNDSSINNMIQMSRKQKNNLRVLPFLCEENNFINLITPKRFYQNNSNDSFDISVMSSQKNTPKPSKRFAKMSLSDHNQILQDKMENNSDKNVNGIITYNPIQQNINKILENHQNTKVNINNKIIQRNIYFIEQRNSNLSQELSKDIQTQNEKEINQPIIKQQKSLSLQQINQIKFLDQTLIPGNLGQTNLNQKKSIQSDIKQSKKHIQQHEVRKNVQIQQKMIQEKTVYRQNQLKQTNKIQKKQSKDQKISQPLSKQMQKQTQYKENIVNNSKNISSSSIPLDPSLIIKLERQNFDKKFYEQQKVSQQSNILKNLESVNDQQQKNCQLTNINISKIYKRSVDENSLNTIQLQSQICFNKINHQFSNQQYDNIQVAMEIKNDKLPLRDILNYKRINKDQLTLQINQIMKIKKKKQQQAEKNRRDVNFKILERNDYFQEQENKIINKQNQLDVQFKTIRNNDEKIKYLQILKNEGDKIGQLSELDLNNPIKINKQNNHSKKLLNQQVPKSKKPNKRDIRTLQKFSNGSPYLQYLPNMLSKQIQGNKKLLKLIPNSDRLKKLNITRFDSTKTIKKQQHPIINGNKSPEISVQHL